MLWNRIRGLWNAYHVILAVILTALYWVILIAISPMLRVGQLPTTRRSSSTTLPRSLA